MLPDLIHTTREWLIKHAGHRVKQYSIDSICETKIYLRCDNCDSIKLMDKVVYYENKGNKYAS